MFIFEKKHAKMILAYFKEFENEIIEEILLRNRGGDTSQVKSVMKAVIAVCLTVLSQNLYHNIFI